MRKVAMATAVVLCACAGAVAQHSDGYESGYTASASGVELNGQNGYYNPVAGSASANVYTYAGNTLGFPQNPTGGENFVGGTGPGPAFIRSQKDVTYPTGVVTVAFDIAAKFTGAAGTAAQNLGSMSTQPYPTNPGTFIQLARWTDPATASTWNADYVWTDAVGTSLTEAVADPGFQNLRTDHWYRWSTTIDMATNQILEVSITDLTTMTTASHNPVDRYGVGGAGAVPSLTGYRWFVGSTVEGNTLGFDNIEIIPAPAALGLFGLAGLAGLRRRR
ncbi:MAG: hypothetical protein ACF8R7_01035 [Phycisphaerales bacterium JB039]